MRSWDDLRFLLSVAEHGSTLAAGGALQTSQSTVFRRIGALEADLGVVLFERRQQGYALTQAGEALLPLARRVSAAVDDFAEAAGREARHTTAVIRFSAPDAAMEYLLPPVMAKFREQYPEVKLEIVVSPRQLDLASGEADVVLRANPAADPDLYGRRLVEERPTLVASREYAQRYALPISEAEVASHAFIDLSGVLAKVLGSWRDRTIPRERIVLRPDGAPSALTAVKGGIGLAVLPQFIVDREPGLVAAPLQLPVAPFELWVLTHKRLRGSLPVRALMEIVADYVLRTTPKRPAAPGAGH